MTEAPTPPAAADAPGPAPGEGSSIPPLHTLMLLGLISGALLGFLVHGMLGADHAGVKAAVEKVAQPIGQLFLRLIFMVVVPLIVSSLLLSVIELGDLRSLGRIGARTLAYTVVASGVSVFLGVGLVNLVRPGAWVDAPTRAQLLADYAGEGTRHVENAAKARDWTWGLVGLTELVPKNPLQSAVDALTGEMLALMVFSLLFGAALGKVRGPETEPIVGVLKALQRASLQLIAWTMALAPVAVLALVFSLTARTGWGVLVSLGAYAGVVLGGLLLQLFGFYPLVLRLIRVPVGEWLRRCREVMLTAFSTSSSNATLPVALRTAEEKLGIDARVGTFVLTVGATGNQNGTALFEGVTVLFLAQVFGVELTLTEQITVVLMSILAGVGTAGVPGGSLPLICIVLESVRVPAEGIAIILGIDRFLDMSRTVTNVVGDLACATYVARGEGALQFERGTRVE